MQNNHGANPCVPYIAVVVKIYLAYTSIIVSPHLWQGDGITRAAKSGNIGAWLSLVEHPIWGREAVSPNLTAPTVGSNYYTINNNNNEFTSSVFSNKAVGSPDID